MFSTNNPIPREEVHQSDAGNGNIYSEQKASLSHDFNLKDDHDHDHRETLRLDDSSFNITYIPFPTSFKLTESIGTWES